MSKILFTILAALGINFGVKSQTEQLDSGLKNTLKITADRFENKNHAKKWPAAGTRAALGGWSDVRSVGGAAGAESFSESRAQIAKFDLNF